MTRVVIVTRDSVEHAVEADENRTLMETIRERGFAELRALCGDCCSCATCHVHVSLEDWNALTPMSEDGNDPGCSPTARNIHGSAARFHWGPT
jgi:2Fe-2S ferredoxin